MKTFFYNLGYFVREAMKTIRFNLMSNLFSVLGTGLILFLLGMVLTGWMVGNQMITSLKKEAEVSAYFDENINTDNALNLVDTIKNLEGVRDATLINETEAYGRMEEILGEEAQILALFDENPFEAFIEVRIHLETMDIIIEQVQKLEGIDYVRDNREVLMQIQNITNGLKIMGLLIIFAVGITTIIIISHMIRQGIYNNREQMNTLMLLGASNSFIGFPFLLVGLLLTLCGGILAIILITILINVGYGGISSSLPFIPLPSKDSIVQLIGVILLWISIMLGLLGSLFGLSSIRKDKI